MRSDLRDRGTLQRRAPGRAISGRRTATELLAGLRGKDVLLVFVESYGRLAVEGSPFSPSVDAVLDAGTRQLAGAGFSARSGWLTSSTFGGGSWWAHATLQSGTWVDTQGRYDELVESNRLTLASAFGRAGWRTVADNPSNERDWPEGASFYHYDRIYDRRNVGYRGPTYAFASMPDQYVLLALQRLELAKPHRPLFAEVDLVSSHTPWTRIPPFIPWERVGDGSIFNRLPVDRSGLTDTQQGYSTSIKYTLRTLFSFVQRYGDKNLVLIVLGDHQPSQGRRGSSGPRRADLDHRPRPCGARGGSPAGAGWTGCARRGGADLAHERLPEPFPQRSAPAAAGSDRRPRRQREGVERVPAPAHLRLQVADVRGGHVHAGRHLRHDGHAAGVGAAGPCRGCC